MQYVDFRDWFDQIENYGMRSERFDDEFAHLDVQDRRRIVEWLRAAWFVARMKDEDEQP